MTTGLDFQFVDLGITEEEFQVQEAKMGTFEPKFFDPGNYDLKILSATLEGMDQKDPTWARVTVEIGEVGGRKIKHFLKVPTRSVKYDGGKQPLFFFKQFREFMAGIGEVVLCDEKSLGKLLPKYFKNLEKLVGLPVNIDIGYRGAYIKYLAKDEWALCKRNGDTIVPQTFPNRDEAEIEAIKLGLKIEKYVNVIKFNECPQPAKKEESW
jgi:hypothetical protein